MQHKEGVLLRLISELDQDLDLLAELAEQNTRATARIRSGATEDLDYAALGYSIHNLHSLLENYALRIAKTFENEIDFARSGQAYARAETRSVGCFRGPGRARHTRREASRSRGGARVVDHAAAGPSLGRRFGLISVDAYCAFLTDFAP